MQVRDLIEELKRHDPHAEVFVDTKANLVFDPSGIFPTKEQHLQGTIEVVHQWGNRIRIGAYQK